MYVEFLPQSRQLPVSERAADILTLESLVIVQSKPHETGHQAFRQASPDTMVQLGSVCSP